MRGSAFSPPQKSDISFDSVCAFDKPPAPFLPVFFFAAPLRAFLALDAEPLPAPLEATLRALRFLLAVLAAMRVSMRVESGQRCSRSAACRRLQVRTLLNVAITIGPPNAALAKLRVK